MSFSCGSSVLFAFSSNLLMVASASAVEHWLGVSRVQIPKEALSRLVKFPIHSFFLNVIASVDRFGTCTIILTQDIEWAASIPLNHKLVFWLYNPHVTHIIPSSYEVNGNKSLVSCRDSGSLQEAHITHSGACFSVGLDGVNIPPARSISFWRSTMQPCHRRKSAPNGHLWFSQWQSGLHGVT